MSLEVPSHIFDRFSFFSDLNDEEKIALGKIAAFRHRQSGKMLFKYGDPLTHIYVIQEGIVQLFHENMDGDELTSDIRTVGDIVCDPGVFSAKETHDINARVITAVTVLMLPIECLQNHKILSGKLAAERPSLNAVD